VSILIFDRIYTSNDLLRRLIEEHSAAPLIYQIVAQSSEDVQRIENALAISMGPYLLEFGQTAF